VGHTPLYRPEVVEAKRNRWLGQLILRQPLSHWVLTWCAIAVVGIVIVFLSIGEYAQKVRVEGQLVANPGLIEITAPTEGVLVSLRYQEGDRVERNAIVGEVRVVQADRSMRTLLLRAPQAGHVTARMAHPGEHIATAQPLLALLPGDAVLEAELYLPDRLLESSAVGSEVLLRYQAFPHQRYGQYRGRIARIAGSPMSTPATAKSADKQTNTNPIYRAVVTLERQTVSNDSGTSKALRPGLRVQADIVLEKRRLYEWLLQPFARLRDRIGG
jgi:multidrug efflux pump subunit AcrA (membrane-fusion protein)